MPTELDENSYQKQSFHTIPLEVSKSKYAVWAVSTAFGMDSILSTIAMQKGVSFGWGMFVYSPMSVIIGAFVPAVLFSRKNPQHVMQQAVLTCAAAFGVETAFINTFYPDEAAAEKEQKLEQAPNTLMPAETLQEIMQREQINLDAKVAYFRESLSDSCAANAPPAGAALQNAATPQ